MCTLIIHAHTHTHGKSTNNNGLFVAHCSSSVCARTHPLINLQHILLLTCDTQSNTYLRTCASAVVVDAVLYLPTKLKTHACLHGDGRRDAMAIMMCVCVLSKITDNGTRRRQQQKRRGDAPTATFDDADARRCGGQTGSPRRICFCMRQRAVKQRSLGSSRAAQETSAVDALGIVVCSGAAAAATRTPAMVVVVVVRWVCRPL